MNALRGLFTVVALLLMCTSVIAVGEGQMLDSKVVVQPMDAQGTSVHVSLLVFNPLVSQSGTQYRSQYEKYYSECKANFPQECVIGGVNDYNCCLLKKSAADLQTTQSDQVETTYLKNAHFRFEYYNMQSGQWIYVPNCQDRMADQTGTTYKPSSVAGQAPEQVEFYYATCDIPKEIYGAQTRTWVRVWFVPQDGQLVNGKEVSISSAEYTIENAKVAPADALTLQISSLIKGTAENPNSQFLCFGLFLIMGTLLASLYFAGKSPISLLDITTPRLPSPKGPVASGQIITPFGYTELKSTINKKMADATKAAGLVAKRGVDSMGGSRNADNTALEEIRKKASISAADKASGKAAQDSDMHSTLLKAGLMAGNSRADLMSLARTRPSDLKDQDFKFIREKILNPLLARGGRDELLARTIDEYLKGKRVMDTLNVLTAHPDIGKPSVMHYKISGVMNKFVGANRYSMFGSMALASVDSTFRTARVGGRMVKAIGTEAPHLARGVGKTLLELQGGARAMQDLEARSKTSSVSAWAFNQLTKHPSKVEVGQMFPVHEKMAHLYKVLRDEAVRDQMSYVLRQLYKKAGIRSDLSEAEVGELGFKNVDILKRINYTAAAAALDREVEHILGDSSKSAYAKLNALKDLAVAHGAELDHRMTSVTQRIEAIDHMAKPEYAKMVLMQELLESENNLRKAHAAGSKMAEDAYICHVGGDTLTGSMIWENMVYRQMVKDKEDGYKNGGIREYAMLGTLEVANRTTGLTPRSGMNQLVEFMRNEAELAQVETRNARYFRSMFSEEAARDFQAQKGKSLSAASINELVEYSRGTGRVTKSGDFDKKTGAMAFWAYSEAEHPLDKRFCNVDFKRYWVTELNARENFALGQWVQSRFDRGHVQAYNASIEAQLDRMSASAGWSVQRREAEAKRLWVADLLRQDVEQRANSLYGQNTYGTTRETVKFYTGVLSGFMEQAMKAKGMDSNHHDMRFIDQVDSTNPKQLSRLSQLMTEHQEAFEKSINKPVYYDDIARSNKAMVMLHEGGFAYYKKGMALSDLDRVMGGQVALKDNKGQLRAFVPEDVTVQFANRDDLTAEYHRLGGNKDSREWDHFLGKVKKWAKEGGYDYDREKVFAATLFTYGQTTFDYTKMWKESAVSVEAKRQVTPVAPSILRFFGVDAPQLSTVLKPFRDIGMLAGDYISKVSLLAGGSLLRSSYDITPLSELYRQRSRELAFDVFSGKYAKDLTKEEQVAYRQLGVDHWRFHQVWDYAIDRHPGRTSTSYGSPATFAAGFNMGPSSTYSVKDNLRAYMNKGEYANFMTIYGFPMDVAAKILMPYQSMVRGMQMSIQGYPSKWDRSGDPMKMWDHTQPRFSEWMQSFNPFSFSWFGGKNSEYIKKLNVFGGSLERSQLAGADFLKGLSQGPQDLFHSRKGIFSNMRTMDANPGASAYDYRSTLQLDAPMGEYLYRNKEGAFFHDEGVRKAAMDNTVRRTVAAEALALTRERELRHLGVAANPLYGWANPFAFLWHMPVAFVPSSITPKEIVSKWMLRAKGGQPASFTDSMRSFAERSTTGMKQFFQPDLRMRISQCGKCGRSNPRGAKCQCGSYMYGT